VEGSNHNIFKGVYGDLVEFADRVSTVLGCPITIEDANHRLLAYSMHDDRTDQARIATIIGRRVPEKVINSLWREGVIPALLKNSSPILIPAIQNVGLGKRAAISIRKNSEVLGFIWALETEKPFTEKDLKFLELAAKEAKNQLLQLQLKKKRREESYQEFLWQLLTGHYEEEAEIQKILQGYGITAPSLFSIIVFTFPTDISSETERNIYYTLTTSQKLKVIFYTINQSQLILLVGPIQSDSFSASIQDFITSFITQMKTRFVVDQIAGAAGLPYSKLSLAKESYNEALYTLKIKKIFPKETASIQSYNSLGIYQYLDVLSQHPHKAVHSGLQLLIEYDKKNQSNLIKTLHAYLECDSNPYDAANSLHVHVNTIHYRLKRISEIGNINLRNPLEKMALLLQLVLLKYETEKDAVSYN
jgi:DNA-binding PucR family transcriptional regulator